MKRLVWVVTSLFLILSGLASGFYYFSQPPSGTTNLLLLGTAGKGYTGEDLTDTILYVSVNHQTAQTTLISVPRDIWIAPLRTKLNSVYHYQNLEGTKRVIEEILNQPVDYGIVINFDLFTQIIDFLGGVEVEVNPGFTDPRYPIAGRENDQCSGDPEFNCRYEQISFAQGKQILNGETALKYVRSRNATGEQGSDFARSKRQQQIILALKNKIFSPAFLLQPQKIKQLKQLVESGLITDLPREKYWSLLKTGLRFRSDKLKMTQLDDNHLINPPPNPAKYDQHWVLVPASGDWQEIQDYVAELLRTP